MTDELIPVKNAKKLDADRGDIEPWKPQWQIKNRDKNNVQNINNGKMKKPKIEY